MHYFICNSTGSFFNKLTLIINIIIILIFFLHASHFDLFSSSSLCHLLLTGLSFRYIHLYRMNLFVKRGTDEVEELSHPFSVRYWMTGNCPLRAANIKAVHPLSFLALTAAVPARVEHNQMFKMAYSTDGLCYV